MRIYVRLAKLKDAKFLLKIHSASIKRGYFNSKNSIEFKDHVEWLKKKIKSNSKIYIGKNSNKKDFGYVRFDETKNNIFEVSIGNLPNFYGKGLGSLLLGKSIEKFKKGCTPKKITSVIKKLNIRSFRCFKKNGFIKIKFDKNKHFSIDKIDLKKTDYFELRRYIKTYY